MTNRGWIGEDRVPTTLAGAGMKKEHWDLLKELSLGPDDIPVGAFAKPYKFLIGIQDRKLSSLSSAQRAWLDDIIEQLDTMHRARMGKQ